MKVRQSIPALPDGQSDDLVVITASRKSNFVAVRLNATENLPKSPASWGISAGGQLAEPQGSAAFGRPGFQRVATIWEDASMGELMFGCPTVPVIRSSEVRFSIETYKLRPIFRWPLSYENCGEIIPVQSRSNWGVPTSGARYDSYHGLRIGSKNNNFTVGLRTTDVSTDGRIAPVERQRVGVASLTLGGRAQFKYWNDHSFWWWPMGDGGDQGDTAGIQFNYNLAYHQLSARDWSFRDLSLTLRLATGIPDRSSAKAMGDGEVYSEVQFSEINRGDIDLSTRLTNRKAMNLTVGLTVNADAVRHVTQGRLIHHNLKIPEFPQTGEAGAMIYFRLTDW
jgi:hypothetical protein